MLPTNKLKSGIAQTRIAACSAATATSPMGATRGLLFCPAATGQESSILEARHVSALLNALHCWEIRHLGYRPLALNN